MAVTEEMLIAGFSVFSKCKKITFKKINKFDSCSKLHTVSLYQSVFTSYAKQHTVSNTAVP